MDRVAASSPLPCHGVRPTPRVYRRRAPGQGGTGWWGGGRHRGGCQHPVRVGLWVGPALLLWPCCWYGRPWAMHHHGAAFLVRGLLMLLPVVWREKMIKTDKAEKMKMKSLIICGGHKHMVWCCGTSCLHVCAVLPYRHRSRCSRWAGHHVRRGEPTSINLPT